MLITHDILLLILGPDKLEDINKADWDPKKHNPIQVVTPYGFNIIGYLQSITKTAIIIEPLVPAEDVTKETTILPMETVIPLTEIKLIFKLPKTTLKKPKQNANDKNQKTKS